jgi:hypothetical protein
MPTWYEQDPERYAVELDLMAKRTKARLYENGPQLYWLESLLSEARKLYVLKVEYPTRFPYERPKAYIISPTISSAPHRFSDGSLCLFRDPSACDVKITALVVRNRAVVWILAYELWAATGEWMAPQH